MLTIKQARVGVGVSQKKMAEMLDLSPITYLKYEKCSGYFPIGKLKRFCQLTETPLSEIIIMPIEDKKSIK